MSAKIIDGNALSTQTRERVKAEVAELSRQGKGVHLAALLIGASPAGELYAQRQGEACRAVGISYELITLPADAPAERVLGTIEKLNQDPGVTGIMLHLPVPPHLDATELQYQMDRRKDVEGVNPANIGHVVYRHTLIAPCTALACIELIRSTGVKISGAEAVVVGASAIAGKPAALLLTEEMATTTLCHIATRDLALHTRRADILVVAVGKPDLIRKEHVKSGAVVIDVGINRVTAPDGSKKTVGDVDYEGVRQVAGYITPVPGGVGPMTVAMLLKNTLRSARLVHEIDTEDDAIPPTTQNCPEVPLRNIRGTDLLAFLKSELRRDEPTATKEIYRRVLDRFGADVCKPNLNCPHYSKSHPEFWHVVRLTLWNGQRAGDFARVGDGYWRRS